MLFGVLHLLFDHGVVVSRPNNFRVRAEHKRLPNNAADVQSPYLAVAIAVFRILPSG